MKREMKRFVFFWSMVLAFWVSAVSVMAEGVSVVQTDTTDDKVIVFVKNVENIQTATMQVGMKLCQDVSAKKMSDIENCYMDTVLLVDNSLSISEKNRVKTKEALKKIINAHAANERFCVITFGETIEGTISFSDNYQSLSDSVDQITYVNQETYVIDALYQVIEMVMDQDDGNFKKIIIASDGVDDNVRGYTSNELLKLMDDNLCPVYSLASLWEKQPEGVESMFEFSRRTNAEYFLLDDYEDVTEIANSIVRDSQLYVVSGTVPLEEMDGGKKNVTVILSTGSGEQKVNKEIEMPFVDMAKFEPEQTETVTETENETETEFESETETETDTEAETETEMESETERQSETMSHSEPETEFKTELSKKAGFFYLWIGIILIAGVVIFLIIFIRRRGRKSRRIDVSEQKQEKKDTAEPQNDNKEDEEETCYMEETEDFDLTADIWNGQKSWTVTLLTTNGTEKKYQYTFSDKITLGKSREKCQIHIEDPYISRQHCEIFIKSEGLYIRDLESKNGTYVNGHKVTGEIELFNNDRIEMGECSLKIEITPPKK